MEVEESTELVCCTNDYGSVIKGEYVIVDKVIRNKIKLKNKSKRASFLLENFKVVKDE